MPQVHTPLTLLSLAPCSRQLCARYEAVDAIHVDRNRSTPGLDNPTFQCPLSSLG